MSKQLVFVSILLTVLLYGWSFLRWYQSYHPYHPYQPKKANSAYFVHEVPTLSSFAAPSREEEFIAPAGDIQVHAAAITQLNDGTLAAVWYGGQYEGSPDTQVYFSTRSYNSKSNEWLPPRGIVSRSSVSKELNRYIKKIGNPLLFTDNENRLHLLFVSVTVGGWSGSSLNLKISPDGGKSWSPSQRLTLSPFLNISELVRNNPVGLSNGSFVVPIYHESIGIFSELLWFSPGKGSNTPYYYKTRLTWGKKYLQSSLVSISPRGAAAFHRSHRNNSRVAMSCTTNTGETWTEPQYIDLPNPGSGLNALPLSDGRILLAFNDSLTRRDNLTLAVSNRELTETECENTERHGKEFQEWRRIVVLENTPGEEFSYPYMLRTRDGKIHMVYTWQRKRIKHISFNEAWLKENITLNDE